MNSASTANALPPFPPVAGHVRAADLDRERTTERLGSALSEGRLTFEEYAERLDAVYHVKTLGELTAITSDLPGGPVARGPDTADRAGGADTAALLATGVGQESIVTVCGSAGRRGRWLVEPRTNISVLMGNVTLDLREAVLARRESVFQSAVLLGYLEVTLPPGVRVIDRTTPILGYTDLSNVEDVTAPDAPAVVLTGLCLMGYIEVKTGA